jgi:tRNA(Ile)-lysidine synthase
VNAPRKNWSEFDHLIWRSVKDLWPEGSRLKICCSGGLDSVVLCEVLSRLTPAKRVSNLEIVYFHHGLNGSAEQVLYRNRALDLVKDLAKKYSWSFQSFVYETVASGSNASGSDASEMAKPLSEATLRGFRREHMLRWTAQGDLVCTAHHRDDLTETRMLRLIRGTSAKGLKSMQAFSKGVFRPFLTVTKQNLVDYAKKHRLIWLEDPSNSEEHYFRNWLRNSWFRDLEAKAPGSLNRLGASLDRLAETALSPARDANSREVFVEPLIIKRNRFRLLMESERAAVIAQMLRHVKKMNYSTSQIFEILKRLDTNTSELNFRVAQTSWSTSRELIWVKVE